MARKTIETKRYTNHPQSKSDEVDTTQPGVDEAYVVDGVVAKFVLELLDEVDSYKGQLKAMENLTGAYGES